MNKKNSVDEVKQAIRNLIYERNAAYEESGCTDGRILEISHDEFRKVDRKCTVNGRRMWLAKTVVREMRESGELIKADGYFGAGGHSKRYRLAKRHEKPAWTPDMDFMAGYECDEVCTTDHDEWLRKFYDDKQLADVRRECAAREQLSGNLSSSNTYTYEGDDWRRYYFAGRR